MGKEYLGLNGLFSNIISMLGIVEMGIGSAIIYNLYKPIAEKNYELVKELLNFYKNSYRVIALAIFAMGIVTLPFLHNFIGEITVPINISIVYILFIIDIVMSYLLSYKRSILIVNQKNYYISIIHIIYLIGLNFLQLVGLFYTKNYYLYLILKIIFRIIENVIITIVANKKFAYIKQKELKKLDSNVRKDIFKKVKGLLFHKIGGFIVLGTDNIIISRYLGITCVALYSNYSYIVSSLTNLITQMFSSIMGSVGNLLVVEDSEKNYQIFKNILYINFSISNFVAVSYFIIISPFITLWVGSDFLFPVSVSAVISLNLYLQLMRQSFLIFKDAKGIFHEDRYVPIIESLANLIISIILVKKIGIIGVLLGTMLSSLVLYMYSYPKYVYKTIFNKNYSVYFKDIFKYLIVTTIAFLVTFALSKVILFKNLYLKIFYYIIICLIFPNLINVMFFKGTIQFNYFNCLIKKKFIK